MIDDGLATTTVADQRELEATVAPILRRVFAAYEARGDEALALNRASHVKYLSSSLSTLSSGFITLDASRTWLAYWIVHSLSLLDAPLPSPPGSASVWAFLASCQSPSGGFGGGPHQLPHLAPTYAAVATLVSLGCAEALEVVDRPALLSFLLRMAVPAERGGGMTMHEGGEVDVRGCYCALAVCRMLGLDAARVAEACDLGAYVRRCQSFEGGLGGEPGNEAHGGYAYCAAAALALGGNLHATLDAPGLLRWALGLQGLLEGGWAGRTNKLVDGCYSFWQGGLFHVLDAAADAEGVLGVAWWKKDDAAQPLDPAQVDELASRVLSDQSGVWDARADDLAPRDQARAATAAAKAEADRALEALIEVEDALAARKDAATGAEAAALRDRARAGMRRCDEAQKCAGDADAWEASLPKGAHALALKILSAAGMGSVGAARCAKDTFDAVALQVWILACCQGPRGGLRDKPGKPTDLYHTCYCLSGLAQAQVAAGLAVGGPSNGLAPVDALCNVRADRLAFALEHFKPEGRARGDRGEVPRPFPSPPA